jgi:hypothetical protein
MPLLSPKGPLFRTIGRQSRLLTRTAIPQANAYSMIRRRAVAAGIKTRIGNHTFGATGITAYLKNGGTLGRQLQWPTMHRPGPLNFTTAVFFDPPEQICPDSAGPFIVSILLALLFSLFLSGGHSLPSTNSPTTDAGAQHRVSLVLRAAKELTETGHQNPSSDGQQQTPPVRNAPTGALNYGTC